MNKLGTYVGMLVTRPDGLGWMPRRGCCSCCWGTGTSPRPDDPGTPKKSVKSLRAVIEISLLKIISSKWQRLQQLKEPRSRMQLIIKSLLYDSFNDYFSKSHFVISACKTSYV